MCHSPVESLALPLSLLLVLALEAFESLHVLNGLQSFVEVVHYVRYEGLDILLQRVWSTSS